MSQLIRNKDFLKLWGGDAISDLGNQVTVLALPLTAIVVLDASPAELGILGAAQFAPFLVFGLIAGVWIDRVRRRPLMIAADVTRAACIGLVPLLAVMDMLTVEILYVVAFVFGTLTLLFDVASQSYLPVLVEADQLSEANAKLQSTGTVAQVAGPAVGSVGFHDRGFVFYTSGSTGVPKGVQLTRGGLGQLLVGLRDIFQLTPSDRVLQGYNRGFDGSLLTLSLAFEAGATLVLPSGRTDVTQLLRDRGDHGLPLKSSGPGRPEPGRTAAPANDHHGRRGMSAEPRQAARHGVATGQRIRSGRDERDLHRPRDRPGRPGPSDRAATRRRERVRARRDVAPCRRLGCR